MPADAALASAQTALVRALVGGETPPVGFDAARLWVTADLLLGKRLRGAAHACPALRPELGARLPALFGAYARAAPRRSGEDAAADAARFVCWLRAQGALTDGLRAAAVELRVRRRPGVAVAWLPAERRVVVGVRLPATRARLLSVTMSGHGP